MTVIVGMIDPKTGDIYMGGDSAASTDAGSYITLSSPTKVFRVGDMALGFCGEPRWGQVLRAIRFPHCPKTMDLDSYMGIYFAQAVREAASAMGYLRSNDGQDFAGPCLVGFRGRMWEVQSSLDAISSTSNLYAIGQGHAYAIGAMTILAKQDGLSPEQILTGAMEVAAQHCWGVGGPFNIVKLEADAYVPPAPRGRAHPNSGRDRKGPKRAPRASSTRRRGSQAVDSGGDVQEESEPMFPRYPRWLLTDHGVPPVAGTQHPSQHSGGSR